MFWNYFKNILKPPLILAGGALATLAGAGAVCLDKAFSAILWLREQFLPASCLAQYLDRHGASRGLIRNAIETEAMWRSRVARAAAWHRLAGKTQGLRTILEQSGYPGSKIQELSGERWAEFILHVPRPETVTLETWDHIIWLANEYKRASSKLAGLIMSLQAPGRVSVAMSSKSGEIVTVLPLMATEAACANALYVACGMITGLEIITVLPLPSGEE
jgi:P2-related tail formation protein